jgi:formamidopyrimidine-DNA glycosylase
MIELPEALVISRQIDETLSGKEIAVGNQGNAPHKFAFYSRPAPEYETIFPGKTIRGGRYLGSTILIDLDQEDVLALGDGGCRAQFHSSEKSLPKKRQLYIEFTDHTYLTVTIQMYGGILLLHRSELDHHPLIKTGVSPLSDQFTPEYFNRLFTEIPAGDSRSVKYFIISKPGILGIANGYTQDILFRAGLHPKRRITTLTSQERELLYTAIRQTVREAVNLCGRDSERDLFGQPGGYRRILDSRSEGQPCPNCGTPIVKIAFLGGASYFCPLCQPE